MTWPGRPAGRTPQQEDQQRNAPYEDRPQHRDRNQQPGGTTPPSTVPPGTVPAGTPLQQPGSPPGTRPTRRTPGKVTRRLIWLAILLLTTAICIGTALRVTPLQTVTVAGQVIRVGATTPTLSISGPGEIDLFGQSLPTNLHFLGPVRPRLQLAQITIDSQLTNFVQGNRPTGAERVLGNALASGWMHYFLWETALTGLGALLLLGALAGWRRLPHRTTVKLLIGGLVITEAVNLGAIMITAYGAPSALRQVRSLTQIVGDEPPVPSVTKATRVPPGVQVVVIGDSTAAGAGLPPVPDASRVDLECGRSSDSYAEDLAQADHWTVMNLACDSATISAGLLGPEGRGGDTVPPQIDAAAGATHARAMIVSVGADDLGW